MDLDEMFRKEAEKYKNSKSVEVYEEQLEGWFKIIDELREENKKLKSDLDKYKKYYDRDKEELMESCYSLARENEKLKSDLAFERTMLDNVKAEYKSSQNVIKKLKEELSKLKEKYGDIDY